MLSILRLSHMRLPSRSAKLNPVIINNNLLRTPQLELLTKRWSGHQTMRIVPDGFAVRDAINKFQFWFVIGAIPLVVITTIANIRANPELREIPEGYEPEHWEYYKHPITRFLARYLYEPYDLNVEMKMHSYNSFAENDILKKIAKDVENAMEFYNDHRTHNFKPYFGEMMRISRDQNNWGRHLHRSLDNLTFERPYDPDFKVLPTEGYKPKD